MHVIGEDDAAPAQRLCATLRAAGIEVRFRMAGYLELSGYVSQATDSPPGAKVNGLSPWLYHYKRLPKPNRQRGQQERKIVFPELQMNTLHMGLFSRIPMASALVVSPQNNGRS